MNDAADRLAAFVCERQRIYHRRQLLQKPPWTEDRVLAAGHFTNVYRELDPGTEWCWREILNYMAAASAADLPQVALNVMVYRLFGLETTQQALGWLDPDPGTIWDAFSGLLAHRAAGNKVFTGAYMVNSYAHMGSDDKLLNVFRLVTELVSPEAWKKFREGFEIMSPSYRQQLVEHLSSFYGWGPFLAYQVLVDLSYPLMGGMLAHAKDVSTGATSWLGPGIGSNDGYVELGPGAWRGLQRVWPDVTREEAQDGVRRLADHLNNQLTNDGLLLLDEAVRPIPLTRANVAACLCEFDKYERSSEPEERPKVRKFDAVASYRRDRDSRGHGEQYEIRIAEEGQHVVDREQGDPAGELGRRPRGQD